MKVAIRHRTEFPLDATFAHALQRIRLTPCNRASQTVLRWAIEIVGAREEVRYADSFGNETRLLSIEGGKRVVSIEASGEVETKDTAGVTGRHRDLAPLWLFTRQTALSIAAAVFEDTSGQEAAAGGELDRLHRLMALAAGNAASDQGETVEAQTLATGERSRAKAHRFIAAARTGGFPARFVSGYVMRAGSLEPATSLCWAEAHVADLGWVGFDPVNCQSPDEGYVAVAIGRDYADVAPVSGIMIAQPTETLAMHIAVEQ